ncbi:hypothetical protein SAMN04515674_10648 [Pseudarcicella hirudinis]|uniref:Uncharacterized protein n=1 Tax=Pseudarcicella hirudinis TaxID=1079859 RepID=A0A1I5THE1_9BACT|nr:hypothetical protein [Pseudarcicella hirudinis]SFP82338.1 hypothetical protein SAMN04515674_10648 [Pseudarcicella hirudinis]
MKKSLSAIISKSMPNSDMQLMHKNQEDFVILPENMLDSLHGGEYSSHNFDRNWQEPDLSIEDSGL